MMDFLKRMIEGKSRKKLAAISIFLVAIFLFLPFGHASAIDLVGDAKSLVYELIAYVLDFIWVCVAFFVSLGAWCVDVFLDPAFYKVIITGQAVEAGWRTVRDFCNMFYIFFLLLVAFSTITRLQAYSAKNVLPKIILSIFFINFSKVITELAIDCGQVFLFGIAGWIGSFSGPTGKGAGLTVMVDLMRSQFDGSNSYSSGTLIVMIISIIYTFMLGAAYFILAGFLLFRLITFVFLIIVSPFAFFGLSLPSMKGYWNQWRSALISNIFAGPVLIFFIYIASIMALDNAIYQPTVETNNLGFAKTTIYYIVKAAIPLGMLYFAVPTAKKMGAYGSKYVSDYGTFAMGAYAGTKLAGKGVSGVASRGHSMIKGSTSVVAGHKVGETYSNAVKKFDEKMQNAPLVGNTYIKYKISQQQKFKAEQDKEKKYLANMPVEQMGTYLKNIVDPQKRAWATAAAYEVLSDKKKLDNDNLMKLKYNDGNGNFDRKSAQKDLQMVKNFGGDVTDVYKRKMDLLDDPAEIEKELGKALGEGRLNAVPLDVLHNPAVKKALWSMTTKDMRDKWITRKAQTEKDSFVKQGEKSLSYDVATGAKRLSDPEIKEFWEQAATLSRLGEMEGRMKPIIGADRTTGKFIYDTHAPVNEDLLKKVLPKIPKNDKLGFDSNFIEGYGSYFSVADHQTIAQKGEPTQKDAARKSLEDKKAFLYAAHPRPWTSDIAKEAEDIDKKIKAIEKTT